MDPVDEGDNLCMDHEANDFHNCGASLVELAGAFGEISLLVKLIQSKVDVADAEVTHKLVISSFNISHGKEMRGQERMTTNWTNNNKNQASLHSP